MRRLWSQRFVPYTGQLDDLTEIQVRADLAAVEHAPLATHPTLLMLEMIIGHHAETGLATDGELAALLPLESALRSALHDRYGAISPGHVIHEGKARIAFYLPATTTDLTGLDALASAAGIPAPAKSVREDPEWEFYREILYPNAFARQTITNRELLASLTRSGDSLDLPRLVDHHANFPSRAAATAATVALAAAGFAVDPLDAADPDQPPVTLSFHRPDSLSNDRADQFCCEIFELIDPFDGNYEGWSAPTATSS